MKNTILSFRRAKEDDKKLTMLTAYDYSTVKLIDSTGVNSILVGDSPGNVVLGYDDMVSVTLDDMIHHGKTVCRGAKNTLVIVDMSFMSYQISVEQALENAGRLMRETHCQTVKLEGDKSVRPQIKAMVEVGIPVCAHLGLTPQYISAFGGFRVQGRTEAAAKQLIEDAKIVQEAGAFAVILEAIPTKLAQLITKQLDIPTIGIGTGNQTDGQVLVYADLLGLFSDFAPKFVRCYANIDELISGAVENYIDDVAMQGFSAPEDEYHTGDTIIEKLY